MTTPPTLPSDRQLLDAARRGDDAAWAELTQRHREALSAAMGNGRAARRRLDDVIRVARTRLVESDPAPEGTPDLRAVRPAMIAAATDGFYGPEWPGVLAPEARPDDGNEADTTKPTDDDPATAGGSNLADGEVGLRPAPPPTGDEELLAVAFATLPDPWQTALWHHHVDGEDVETVAPHVGRAPDDVDELLATARRGLIDAFFREYESLGPFASDAASVVPLLAGYHRRSLSAAEQDAVVRHLRRDHIAVAPSPESTGPEQRTAVPTPNSDDRDEGAVPLAPPTLRPHDAVDSRRLLDLASSLDRRLAAAIAPGVTLSTYDVPAPAAEPVPQPPDHDAAERRRRMIATVAAVALVVAVVVAAIVIGGSSGGDDADPGLTPVTQPDGSTDDTDTDDTDTDDSNDPTDGDADDADDGDSSTAPPVTTLALRPDAEGPLTTISVEVDDDAEPLGFAAPSADVSVTASAPAPVFAGGSGTLDFAVVNDGPAPATIGLRFALPRGVRYADAVGGACVDPDDDSPACTIDVGAGETGTLAVRFLLESSIVGRLEVDGDVAEPFVTPISATPHLVHSSVGRGGVAVVGNTVTQCDDGAAASLGIECDSVADGTGEIVNRWDVPIEFVGAAPQIGLFNSSSATLELPAGAEVVEAQLFWSGDLDERGVAVPDDGRATTISLGLPGGDVESVEAGRVVLGDVDASQYLGWTDVTDLVRGGGAGRYTVANVHTVEVQGSYGAWALVVVYDHDDDPRRHRLVTRPFEWVAPVNGFDEPFVYEVDVPVPAGEASTVELDVFALEGELGFLPESFVVGDEPVGGDNPFDSSIEGDRSPDEVNNLGVDIDTYALTIDTSDGRLPIRATSEKDGFRVAVLGLTVDIPT